MTTKETIALRWKSTFYLTSFANDLLQLLKLYHLGKIKWSFLELGLLSWGQLPSVDSNRQVQFSSVQLFSRVRLFATPWTAARQASLSVTNSRSRPKPMSIKSVMPSSHLILCRPLLLLPPILPSIRVFSSESTDKKISKISSSFKIPGF